MKLSNLKIVVVDDEVIIAEYIKDVLLSMDIQQIELAHNKASALHTIEIFKPDIILLDIRLKVDQEGIEIGEIVQTKYTIPFIYITSHSDKDMIAKALSTKPFSYLTKPIKKADLYAALELFVLNAQQTPSLVIKDGRDVVKIKLSDILYLQSSGNYTDIYCTTKKYSVRQSLEKTLEELPAEIFKKIHRTIIVNTEKITKVATSSVFINEVELPVSRGIKINI